MRDRSARLIDFFALRRSIVALMFMAILVGTGENIAERFLPIYLMALGAGPLIVGLLNALDNFLSAIYSHLGGWLSNRMGPNRALMLFNILAVAGFLTVIAIPTWQGVLIGACLFLSWTAISLPATMKMIAHQLPETKRTMGVTMHSLTRRVPMSLGPMIGGVLLTTYGDIAGTRLAFGCAAVLAIVAIFIQRALMRNVEVELSAPMPANPAALWRELDPMLKELLLSDILVRFCEQIPYAFLGIWCMKTIAHPVTAAQFGLLTAIEMVAAMLIYIPVALLADRGTKKPYVVMTFVNFTLFPVALYFSRSFVPLVFAFILRGLKEFGEPTRKALIIDLAPRGREDAAFGLYYLVRDLIVSIGAFSGGVLWLYGPAANFFTAAAFGTLGTVLFALFGRNAPARAEEAA